LSDLIGIPLIQGVNEPAVLNVFHYERRKRRESVSRAFGGIPYLAQPQIHFDGVSIAYSIRRRRTDYGRQPYIDAVAKENPGKRLGHDRHDSGAFESERSVFSAGAISEIETGSQYVPPCQPLSETGFHIAEDVPAEFRRISQNHVLKRQYFVG
jgi:hypothetical protein